MTRQGRHSTYFPEAIRLPGTDPQFSKANTLRRAVLKFLLYAVPSAAALAACVCAGAALVIEFYVFPLLEKNLPAIEQKLTEAAGAKIRIGGITPVWSGINPGAALTKVSVERDGRTLGLAAVDNLRVTLSWESLFRLSPITDNVSVDGLYVYIERTRPRDNSRPSDRNRQTLGDVARAIESASGHGWLDTLLAQHAITISNAVITYKDAASTAAPPSVVTVPHVRIEKKAGSWHWDLRAHIEGKDIRSPVSASGRLSKPYFTDPAHFENWEGSFDIDFASVNFAPIADKLQLGRWIRSGTGQAVVSGTYAGGALTSVSCSISFSDVLATLAENIEPVRLDTLSATITEDLRQDYFNVTVTDLLATSSDFGDHYLPKVQLFGAFRNSGLQDFGLKIQSIDLELVDYIARRVPEKNLLLGTLVKAAPRGEITDFDYHSAGPAGAPRYFGADGRFRNVSVNPSSFVTEGGFHAPGWNNLSGSFSINDEKAEIILDSTGASLTFPGVFTEETLKTDELKLKAAITFKDRILVDVENAYVRSGADTAQASGYWHQDASRLGTLKINGTIAQAAASSIWRYIPLCAGGKETNDWLRYGLVGGTGSNAVVDIYGALENFPFEDKKNGERFIISGDIRDGAIDYVPTGKTDSKGRAIRGSWPLLENINGRITFDGMSIAIKADSASTLGTVLKDIDASIPGYNLRDCPLYIRGSVTEELEKMVAYVEKSPISELIGHALDGSDGTGRAGLDLSLRIPLLSPKHTQVKGVLTFNGNTVAIRHAPGLRNAKGSLTFTENGLYAESIAADVLDMPSTGSIDTLSDGTIRIRTTTPQATPDGIAFIADSVLVGKILSHASGSAAVDTVIDIRDGVTIRASSTLEGLAYGAPEPFNKAAPQSWPLDLYIGKCSRGEACSTRQRVSISDRFFMDVGFDRSGAPVLGKIFIGGLDLALPAKGISVGVSLDKLEFKDWLPILSELSQAGAASETATPFDIHDISVRIGHFSSDGLTANSLSAKAVWTGGKRRLTGTIESDAAAGSFEWTPDDEHAGTLTASLSRLYTHASTLEAQTKKFEVTPMNYPRLNAAVKDFRLDGAPLGSLAIRTSHQMSSKDDAWNIDSATLKNSAFTVKASGSWKAANKKSTTSLTADIYFNNLGEALAIFGKPLAVTGGSGSLSGQMSWDGAPTDFSLKELNGHVTARFAEGSVPDVDTGAAKVFGVLSLTRLIRRLAFDFRDMTNTLLFNSLSFDADIERGVLTTDSLKMAGPQASILASGSVDLAQKKPDLSITVIPEVSFASASIALGLANPLLGIGAFVTQFALQEPIAKALSREYTLKGTFDAPELKSAADE